MSQLAQKAPSLTPDQVVESARQYLGVPFKHQGRTVHGMDCVGMLQLMAKGFGLNPRDEYGYGANVGQARSESIVRDECVEVPRAQRQPGDLMLMHLDSEEPQHWVIFTGSGIIHACAKYPRKVVEHGLSDDWARKIRKVYRLRKVIDS